MNNSPSKLYPSKVDVTNCDKEPIHIIGKVQNHGVFLACEEKNNIITYSSDNTTLLFNENASEFLGKPITDFVDKEIIDDLFDQLEKKNTSIKETNINEQNVTVIVHKSDKQYVLEFEINTVVLDSFQYQLQLTEIASEINNTTELKEKSDRASSLIKAYFGYDRVMIYQFDNEFNGSIISESKEPHLESWLGLQYPASDIPKQARKLFLKQGVRIINDVNSEPVDIISSITGDKEKPIDLSTSELRSASPIHIEYLINMKVGATLTAAIVYNDTLWGLVACHHYSPKYINYYQRLSCKFLTQMFATSIQLNATDEVLEKLKKSSLIRSALIDQIDIRNDIFDGLSAYEYTMNDLTNSTGAAIYMDKEIITLGTCPSKDQIVSMIKKIKHLANRQLYYTNNLMNDFSEAKSYKEVASGVLCLFISNTKDDALIWFKPEVIETIHWAGNPNKMVSMDDDKKLSPRKSFEKWSVEQSGKSRIWEDYEISEGVALQKNIVAIIIEKFEEVRELNNKLKIAYEELESFSYSVSHDLRAPLRGIDGFAHIIKEEYYESLDDFGKSSITTIISSVNKMNMLIDDILEYSGLGKKQMQYRKFSLEKAINELLPDLQAIYSNVKVVIQDDLPLVYGDLSILFLLLKNLLENALKYSSKVKDPLVTIGFLDEKTFFIKDNGIGFEMKHESKIFGVFNRLVNEEYSGSGIGLAIAKRVIDKHNGKIWVDSEINKGSTFYFKLGINEK